MPIRTLIAVVSALASALAFAAENPLVSLIPMPHELRATGGECRKPDAPKVEAVATIPPEGYELSIAPDGVTIRHSDDAGLFYAQMTLKQLLDGAADGALPCETSGIISTPWMDSMPEKIGTPVYFALT